MRLRDIIFIVVIVHLFHSCSAHAEDQWACTTDGSERIGNTIAVCGVATSDTEGNARKHALDNAIYEFQATCNLSSDCKGRKVNVETKRGTCSFDSTPSIPRYDRYTCHRLFLFTIQ